MKQYEVIHEIPNQCSNNQMRDVFFEEVQCESPVEYVKKKLAGKEVNITVDEINAESCIIHAETAGLTHKFSFTEL